MKLEAVVTSVNYDDFLSETLPLNKVHFDNMVVVTSPEDLATQKLCEYYHVKCVPTNAFGAKGEFRKGAAINAGLRQLDLDGWVIQLDADIALPPQTRRILEAIDLDAYSIYGIDRFNVMGRKAWDKHKRHPALQQENDVYVHLNAFPLGTRFISRQGWIPIGFFQLWNPHISSISLGSTFTYPENHTNAGRTDMMHAARWPSKQRHMLPELVAYHLESEPAEQGANWEGRQTARFDEPYTICGRFRRWWRHHCRHHKHHHSHPYWEQDPTNPTA